MLDSILIYVFLFSVPLLPVITLYRVFEEQSYFELSGLAKGIVATGPIAAYAVFAYVGAVVFKDLFKQRGVEKQLQKTRSKLAEAILELEQSNAEIENLKSRCNEFKNAVSAVTPTQAIVNELVGRWSFISTSSHNRVLTGNSDIQFQNGLLKMRGRFYQNGAPVGSWYSESAQVMDNSLIMVYRMEEQKNGELQQHRGVCTFQLDSPPFFEMLGFWVVVGRREMFGRAEYKKILSS